MKLLKNETENTQLNDYISRAKEVLYERMNKILILIRGLEIEFMKTEWKDKDLKERIKKNKKRISKLEEKNKELIDGSFIYFF